MEFRDHGVQITREFHYYDQRFLAGSKIGAYQNGKLIGFVSYNYIDTRNELDLLFIEVLPEYRRSGLAKKLIQEMMNKMRPSRVVTCPETDIAKQMFENLVYQGHLPDNTVLI